MARQRVKSPQTIIARFVARNNLIPSAIWGIVFGIVIASSALGYLASFNTVADKNKFAIIGSNPGLEAFLGKAHDLNTVAGFTAWRGLGLIMLVGAIMAILTSTKNFRGEEESGRWEILLSSETTPRLAVLETFTGLGTGLLITFMVTAVIVVLTGQAKNVNFSFSDSLFFSIALMCSSLLFFSVGALTSQLFAFRRTAAAWAAGIFGVMFLIRAVANSVTGAEWIGWFSPLHWIDQLQPLTDPQPLWLVPIFALTLILMITSIFLAGRRDLATSIIKDKDSSKPHKTLLGSTLLASLRLQADSILGWWVGIGFFGIIFGSIAPSATNITSSSTFAKTISNLTGTNNGIKTFIGLIFAITSLFVMLIAASQISAIREQEAKGFWDNFLVQPLSRIRLILERTLISVISLIAAGLIVGISAWLGIKLQNATIGFGDMIVAGLNLIAPAILIFALGVFSLGLVPRLTNLITYGFIAWSFLVELIGTVIKGNHWLLDTSLLHHIPAVPAVDFKWQPTSIMLAISLGLILAGLLRFAKRDLTSE